MIKNNNSGLKKIAAVLAVFVLISSIAVYKASASEISAAGSNAERGQQIMSQMMGSNYASMDNFMDQMMGESGTEAMYGMMGKISAAGLSANDTKPLSDFMTACQSRTGNNYGFGGMMGNWSWGNMMGAGFGGGILGGIIMIFFWLIVILAGVALLRWLADNLRGNTGTSSRPIEILKEKYAKGEIAREEFETKKKDLA